MSDLSGTPRLGESHSYATQTPAVPPHLLVSFHSIAEHKSVSHAATIQCVPYAVMAKNLARLEGLLGTTLLEQKPGRMRLTVMGERIFAQTRPHILALQSNVMRALETEVQRPSRALEPVLNVQLSIWGMAAILKPYLQDLRGLPCGLNFVNADTNKAPSADVICYLGKRPIPGYETQTLFGEEIVAVCSADYPCGVDGFLIDDLKHEPLLRLGHGDHISDWQSFLGIDPDGPVPGISKAAYTSFSNYVRAIRAGRGVGVGLAPLFAADIAAGTLRFASQRRMWRNRACYLGVKKTADHPHLARDLADIVRRAVEPDVSTLPQMM